MKSHERYDNTSLAYKILTHTYFYIKRIVTYASMGIFLYKVYPNERVDNFFIYEQFLISVIWLAFSYLVVFFQAMSNGDTYRILTLVLHFSELLQIMFELTLPLYFIQKYGYPDAPIENPSSSDTNLSSDRLTQATEKTIEGKLTSDSFENTMRSQLGIDEIMGDKHFRDLFSKYLGREFQMEVFMFFDALHYHKDAIEENANSVQLLTKEDAQRIIDEFIVDDAINKLPISDRLCKQIIIDFNKVDDENPANVATIFQEAIDNLKTRLSFVIYKFNINV